MDALIALDADFRSLWEVSVGILRRIAELDEAEAWQRDGATSMTPWLAARYGLSRGRAREWVRVARAIRALPEIERAFARGELSWDQLAPVTRLATPETDARWARRAARMRPQGLWLEVRRRERVALEVSEDLRRQRYLNLDWDLELPLLHLQGTLPAEEGAALERAIRGRAEQVQLADEPDDPSGARRADALVEIASGADVPTLVVHADAEVLTMEGGSLSETEEGAQLPSEAARRLACDARVEWVLEREGRAVGIGRRGRAIPGQIVRVLRHRDRGCRFPGCERTQWLRAHHLVHWARGGGTDLDNLILLCHAHHRLLHEGGWRTSGHPARELRFHGPDGAPRPQRSSAVAVRGSP